MEQIRPCDQILACSAPRRMLPIHSLYDENNNVVGERISKALRSLSHTARDFASGEPVNLVEYRHQAVLTELFASRTRFGDSIRIEDDHVLRREVDRCLAH